MHIHYDDVYDLISKMRLIAEEEELTAEEALGRLEQEVEKEELANF